MIMGRQRSQEFAVMVTVIAVLCVAFQTVESPAFFAPYFSHTVGLLLLAAVAVGFLGGIVKLWMKPASDGRDLAVVVVVLAFCGYIVTPAVLSIVGWG